jgi:hypothetical protein
VEFCRDTTIQDLIVVAGVALVFTLISFSAGPVLIAYIVLIYIQRLTHDIRTAIVALLSTLRSFNAGPAPIAYIILIHVQRFAHDIRTVLVALLSTLRLIVLLRLIATLRAFSFLHIGLQEYRVQSLRKGRDRQCKTHPKHATSAELVKIAHRFSTAVGFGKVCAMPNAKMTSLRTMAPCKGRELAGDRDCRTHVEVLRFSDFRIKTRTTLRLGQERNTQSKSSARI